jgi:hypothetical protein
LRSRSGRERSAAGVITPGILSDDDTKELIKLSSF